MKIAKIVRSNSHIDYVGRVIDALDSANPPAASDYGFGQFVGIPMEDMTEFVGVIYDSLLLNPDYGSYGPRLSPQPDLGILSPDYLNEQGLLVGIFLLGWRDKIRNECFHGVPRGIVPVNQDVHALEPADVCAFHTDDKGKIRLHYYSQVTTVNGLGAFLLDEILKQLSPLCGAEDQKRLQVLKTSLVWQRTLGNIRS